MKRPIRRRALIRSASYLLAVFVVLGGLAFQGHSRAAAYERHLANTYRHAFAELSTNLSELDTDLQKGIYATSPAMLGSLCTQIFGKALSAQMALGELPYGNVELEQTAAFLAKTGDYAASLARTAAVSGGCTQEQRDTLKALSAAAADLSVQVASMQTELLAGAATLEDVERAEARLSSATEQGQELAGTTFQTIEGDFPELPSLIYDGPFSEHIVSRSPRVLEGLPQVTRDEARLSAARSLGLKPEIFTLTSASEGRLPTYGFTAAVDGGELYVEVTRQGGLVIELFSSRWAGEPVLTAQEAVAAAASFLEAQGYPDMRESYFIDQGGVLTVNFAASQGDVLCYPDLIKVSVALDTGKVVGFEAEGYLMNHTQRALPQPAVTQQQAQAVVSPDLTVLGHQMALIPTAGEYEVLCHEFKCRAEDGKHILVYVNAQNGQEEKILILLEDESGTLVI